MQMKIGIIFVFLHPMSRRISAKKKFLKDIAIIDIAEEVEVLEKPKIWFLVVEKLFPVMLLTWSLCAEKEFCGSSGNHLKGLHLIA